MAELNHKRVRIDDLRAFPGNARRGDLEMIKESLRVHGQFREIVVQESTGYILAGNHTWRAAKELGWDEIDIGVVDCDDEQAKRIVLVDNRSNDVADYDNQALADLLVELDTLDGTGFEQDDVDSLLASLGPGGFKQAEIDQVIKVPKEPVTKPGEVVTMGPHVLICGDSLSQEFVDTYEVDMVWTDPPYLISYQHDLSLDEAQKLHRRTDGKQITNENLSQEDAYVFRDTFAALLAAVLKPGGPYYIHVPPGPDQAYWINALEARNLKPRQVLQWVKDQFVFGRSDYHYRSEPVLYGWREGAAHIWKGGRSQDSVWEFDRPKRSKDHPTIKPVELAIRAIENSTEPGDLVFDPFAGSGTILVAAMQTGRRALMCEIDPAYCDVIIERFERLTGDSVRRLSEDGRS